VATLACPLPAPLALRRMSMVWHERLSQHPAHVWLRETMSEVGSALAIH
jgi:DNA-binding transcriptional LysR family regulator